MYSGLSKNIAKIVSEFSKLEGFSKKLIKYGTQVFLALLSVGTLLIVLNRTTLNYDTYIEYTAKSIVKNSFSIFAEIIIGALVIDYVLKKN